MPQNLNQKAVNNFVRGLITEAGELTFPEGASVDELNCDLRRDGSRRRRLGVAYEDSNVLSAFTLGDSEILHTGDWVNVGGNADLEFLVVQKGSTLYFYNKGGLPYSAQIESNSVDLTSNEYAGSLGAENSKCQFASIKGNLIVSSPQINTVAIEYDINAGTFTVTEIEFEIRDFEWQGDTSTYYNNESSPSQDRKYDAQNTGWNTGNGAPSDLTKRLTHPWYSGKDSSGNYSSSEWEKVYAGTTLTGNGHYILDFFTKDRGSKSGLTGLTKMTDPESTRFRSVESFAGRVFYAGLDSAQNAGTILFSKLVDTIDDLGICHQQNDPTSEQISDLLDTDGGVIRIPDAVKILRLYAFQNSLFVFAENGIWQISGVDGVFRASEFAVNRVSRIGILNPETFVSAEGVPFWWSTFGIHTLQTDPVSGQGSQQNLTIPTIQSFWDQIDADAKLKVTATYDGINKRIYWAYPDNDETITSKLNNFLVLDIPLQAFYPWKISDQTSNTDAVVGMAFYSGYGAKELELDVTSNGGADDVVSYDVLTATSLVIYTTQNSTQGTMEFIHSSHTVSVGDSVNIYSTPMVSLANFLGIDVASIQQEITVSATTSTSFTVPIAYTANQNTTGSLSWPYAYEYGNVSTANDVVSAQISTFTTGDPAIILICRNGSDNKITMGGFTSTSFLDWGDTNYTSFAETGYDFIGDPVLKKNAPYLITYCRLTETGFTGNEVDGYEAIRPSSALVSSAWDFKDTFSTSQQIYRKKYPVVVDPNNISEYNYPEDVITTRVKIRGHGRSMRLRYESEQGKDFILLGWGIILGRNPRF